MEGVRGARFPLFSLIPLSQPSNHFFFRFVRLNTSPALRDANSLDDLTPARLEDWIRDKHLESAALVAEPGLLPLHVRSHRGGYQAQLTMHRPGVPKTVRSTTVSLPQAAVLARHSSILFQGVNA